MVVAFKTARKYFFFAKDTREGIRMNLKILLYWQAASQFSQPFLTPEPLSLTTSDANSRALGNSTQTYSHAQKERALVSRIFPYHCRMSRTYAQLPKGICSGISPIR